MTTVLGIETSCDDTAVGIVSDAREILAEERYVQIDEHAPYGGIVPEIAARSHVEHLDRLVEAAFQKAGLAPRDIDAVAATAGPGLIGGLMIGLVTGKALAFALDKPFLAINHLEGHALSIRLVEKVDFPYLLLLISGGHCQLLWVEGVGRYRRLGTTLDDSVGEAFDKAAQLLGLGFPGGPEIEMLAKQGEKGEFHLPRPLLGEEAPDFSFSGLKTALWREAEALGGANKLTDIQRAGLAREFQAAIADCLEDRTQRAMTIVSEQAMVRESALPAMVVAGGVAANAEVKSRLEQLSEANGWVFHAPPPWLCTDNGAMIAWAGIERLRCGKADPLDAPARARWPLDEKSPPKVGFGKRGAKV